MATLTGVDERIARVEQILQEQSRRLQMNQYSQVKFAYGTRAGSRGQKSSSSPAILGNFLGRLFVGFAGLPVLNQKCDTHACKGAQSSKVSMSMEYWFPASFWSSIVRVDISYHHDLGPSLQLRTLRRVPDTAQCVNYALGGNIDGLKFLLTQGLASPRDTSPTRGYSLLQWTLYGTQYETCRFLIQAGSDADYKPLAAFYNSPRIKACHFLLEGNLSEPAKDALRTITKGGEYLDDFIDESQFTQTHRIVLGLSSRDLEQELLAHPHQVNAQDTTGRTAVAWAAARGDSRAIVTLLRHGADPNIIDSQLSVLLDFGAEVDQAGVDGKTALFHAAQNNDAALAMLLLEYGAEVNTATITGDTPLTTAITHNSHHVLRLFLERWLDYSVCPRLTGPHLLSITARYADLQTIDILAGTDHFRLEYDERYLTGDFSKVIRERPDATGKLASAFEELLSIFKHAAHLAQDAESLLEAGHGFCLSSRSKDESQEVVNKRRENVAAMSRTICFYFLKAFILVPETREFRDGYHFAATAQPHKEESLAGYNGHEKRLFGCESFHSNSNLLAE
ncbi:uncharacterized protein UV8b_07363 [Ustilaginoidea virens]|uniref:Ankyrin repeat protein n=1 Tax=Ustilaginoidea virens TaxID=1159556 RepID=A0A8E5MKX6_USTVR|nr:uncharacterized protein UV8b_07363 [Ustilaginoidea virens]QUC23122.1 hypothetical protein UV8b_07363 [Ustilaginoidea virens]